MGIGQSEPVQEGRGASVIAHVGFFHVMVLVALAVRLTAGRRNDFARHHRSAALNIPLTVVLIWLLAIGSIVVFPDLYTTTDETFEESTGPWILVPFTAIVASVVVGGVLSVIGAVRAGQGRWWRTRLAIPFVPGVQASATRSSRSSLQ